VRDVVPETDVVSLCGAAHHGTCGEECRPAPEEAIPEREHLLSMRTRLLVLQLLQDGALHGRVERVEERLEAEELGRGGGSGEGGGRGGHH
jgi:hypothetical protein